MSKKLISYVLILALLAGVLNAPASAFYTGGNINISGRNDITQQGSAVAAQGDVTYTSDNLNFIASEDSYRDKFSSESYHAGVSFGNGQGDGGNDNI